MNRTYPEPFEIIFDNDMGNDIDDALAQCMVAYAVSQGRTRLRLSLSSNPNEWSVYTIDAINRYYGMRDVPLGIHKGRVLNNCTRYGFENGGYTRHVALRCRVEPKGCEPTIPDAVTLLRAALHAAPDHSVRVVATGFATNLARLLLTGKDPGGDGIPFTGVELAAAKVQFLSIMACDFAGEPEYNVVGDVPAMALVMERWPTDVIVSDYAVGSAILSQGAFVEKALADENPVKIAYRHFYGAQNQPVGNRPSWDQTAMLFALEPAGDHFAVSHEGRAVIYGTGKSEFIEQPGGKRFRLYFDAQHPAVRTAQRINEYYREPGT